MSRIAHGGAAALWGLHKKRVRVVLSDAGMLMVSGLALNPVEPSSVSATPLHANRGGSGI
jgi:hypothetical protein